MSGTTAEPLGGPDPSSTARWLERHRPDLHPAYLRELPSARAAVLRRLTGAIKREHLQAPTGYADPALLLRAMGHDRFAAEVDNSVANLALAQATQPPPDGGPPALTRPTPPHWEQLVVDGHPLHPGCRTRTGMTTGDVLAYAPEHRTVVDLVQVAVPPGRWHSTGAGLPPLLHLHPWQAERVRDSHPELRPVGTRPARPLMSLRTLAPLDDPTLHLKTAIDAQLTSAVRTVSAAAVENGPILTAFLAALTDKLTVLREHAAGAVLTDGAPDRRLAVVHRQAPPPAAIPLAALSAPSPADGAPLAREAVRLAYAGDPRPFLADLTRLLVTGTLDLLDLGIGLEAHGQNLLVTLDRGRPATLYYRDVGGIRIDPERLAKNGITAPPLHGDLRAADPDEPETTVLAALTVVLGQLVGTLADATATPPADLWAAAATTAGDRLTHRDTLPIKATTTMRLAASPSRQHAGRRPPGTPLGVRPEPAPGAPVNSDLDEAARHTAERLSRVAPALVGPFRAALPRAAATVGRRLAGALYREDIGDARERFAGLGRRHGFDRLEVDKLDDPPTGPAEMLPRGLPGAAGLAEELTNATVNLALAYARPRPPRPRHATRTGAPWRTSGSPSTATTCTRAAAPGSAGTPPTPCATTSRPAAPPSRSSPYTRTCTSATTSARPSPTSTTKHRPATTSYPSTSGSATPSCATATPTSTSGA